MGKEGFSTLKFKFHQPAVEASSPIGTVTSRFGDFGSFRTHPYQGVDYACPVGTEIHAPIDGVVSSTASNHLDVTSIANQNVDHVQHSTALGTWLADKVSGAARFIVEPIGNALGDGLKALFVGTMNALPMALTVGGLICFLLTIALGNHRPYFWGLGMWAGSAIVRGINIEAGI